MALREKLRDRVQPHLEPGEPVQSVFLCQTGPSPWFGALSALVILLGAHYYVVAVTDRRIVVLNASRWLPSMVKGFHTQLPRQTVIGPTSGLWATTNLLGVRTHIAKRFHKDVELADSYIGGRQVGYGYLAPSAPTAPTAPTALAPAAGWYADPHDPARRRWWDGSAWTDHTA